MTISPPLFVPGFSPQSSSTVHFRAFGSSYFSQLSRVIVIVILIVIVAVAAFAASGHQMTRLSRNVSKPLRSPNKEKVQDSFSPW